MHYRNLLNKLIEKEKRPVNKMYLNEISIKWSKVEKYLELEKLDEIKTMSEKNEYFRELSESINDYLTELGNPKYNYSNNSNKGFKKNSSIFIPEYITDLLTLFLHRTGVLDISGVVWGKQQFNLNHNIEETLNLGKKKNKKKIDSLSPEFLALTRKIDISYRASGEDNFTDKTLNLPLIVFFVFTNIKQNDFIVADYYSKLAKNASKNAKCIILARKISDIYKPFFDDSIHMDNTAVDDMLILNRRSTTNSPFKDNILLRINDMIFDALKIRERLQNK